MLLDSIEMVSNKLLTGLPNACSDDGMKISATKTETICLSTVQTTKAVLPRSGRSITKAIGEIQVLRSLNHKR